MKFILENNDILITINNRIFLQSAVITKEGYTRLKFPIFKTLDDDVFFKNYNVFKIDEIINLPFKTFNFRNIGLAGEYFLKETILFSFLIPYFINKEPLLNFKKEKEYYYIALPMNPYLSIDVFTSKDFEGNQVPKMLLKGYFKIFLQQETLIIEPI